MSSHQLNSKNNNPVLLFKTIKALKVFPVVYYCKKKKKTSNFTATARPWRNFFFDVSFFITLQEQFVEADNWPKTAISLKITHLGLRCCEHVFYDGSVNSKRARLPLQTSCGIQRWGICYQRTAQLGRVFVIDELLHFLALIRIYGK